MASSFVLPDFFAKCPYTLRVSPHRDTLTRKSQEWILSQAKLSPERQSKFLQTEAGVLTAYCYPDADYSRLQIISDWMEWVICIDDWTDEFDEKETESLGSCIMNCLRDPHGYQTDKAAGRLIKEYVNELFVITHSLTQSINLATPLSFLKIASPIVLGVSSRQWTCFWRPSLSKLPTVKRDIPLTWNPISLCAGTPAHLVPATFSSSTLTGLIYRTRSSSTLSFALWSTP